MSDFLYIVHIMYARTCKIKKKQIVAARAFREHEYINVRERRNNVECEYVTNLAHYQSR